jgi:hypothetical protein
MKTCVNCKYITRVSTHRTTPHCGHEKSVIDIDMVSGDISIFSCTEMREGNRCGVDAKLYEEKNTQTSSQLVYRLKNWFFA